MNINDAGTVGSLAHHPTVHDLCYTNRAALAGMGNISMGSP